MPNHEQYSPSAVNPYEFIFLDQHNDALEEASEQRLGTAANGQQFSAVHVNRGLTDKPTFVRINSLFGNTANTDQQYIAYQFAAAFPHHSYLSIDLPAHGASDKLTMAQRKDFTKSNGSLATIAEAQVEATLDLIPELKNIVLTGEAMGELFATEFALQAMKKGLGVKHVFGFDPIGLEDRSPLSLASSYLANAQKSRNSRRKESNQSGEQELEDAYSKVFVPQIESYGPTKEVSRAKHAGVLAKERTIVRLMLQKSPITNDNGLNTLEQTLHADPNVKVNLLFAGRSVIGRLTEKVLTDLEVLKTENQNRLQIDEWPNDNQDIGLARHQPRLIKYIKDNLN